MAEEIIKANQSARRVFLVFTIIFGVIFYIFFPHYQERLKSLTELSKTDAFNAWDQIFIIYSMVFLTGAGFTILFGLYILRLSYQILMDEQYPPKGFIVLRDTKVIRGDPAKTKAYVGFVISFLLLISGLSLPYLAFNAIRLLFH